jgi:ElaB/YqjD/DUF883 family membrane-anchored ribosome-binding protein
MRQEHPSARDVARKELREVLASTEALLEALGDEGGESISQLRARLTETIADVRSELGSSLMDSAREKIGRARDSAASVNEFVQERPWSSVLIAAGIGLLAGLLMKD